MNCGNWWSATGPGCRFGQREREPYLGAAVAVVGGAVRRRRGGGDGQTEPGAGSGAGGVERGGGVGGGGGAAQGEVEFGLQGAERGAQFVAGVGDGWPVAVGGGLRAGEHVVERGGEAGDFVAAGRDIQAAVRGQGGR